jgi:hypothetical protein
MMEPRIHFEKYAPEALRAMYSLERHLIASSLGEGLLHLEKNARFPSMVARTAWTCIPGRARTRRNRAALVWTERLARDALYSAREQAALEWTEALTLVALRSRVSTSEQRSSDRALTNAGRGGTKRRFSLGSWISCEVPRATIEADSGRAGHPEQL